MEVCPLKTDYVTGRLLETSDSISCADPEQRACKEGDHQLKFIRVNRASGFGVIGGGDERHGRGKTPRTDGAFLNPVTTGAAKYGPLDDNPEEQEERKGDAHSLPAS